MENIVNLPRGGAIGDALFFFCSGFTLFLGRMDNLFNWYKRRLSRIIPSLLAIGIVSCILWGNKENITSIVTGKTYWFIPCILVYYFVLYFVRKYLSKKTELVFLSYIIVIIAAFLLFCDPSTMIYSNDDFRQFLYFIFMLQGAIMGEKHERYKYSRKSLILWVSCILLWYVIYYFWGYRKIQILSIVPMVGILYYGYLLACAPFWQKLFSKKIIGNILWTMGSLCLEVYLIQKYIFTDKLNFIFPVNVPIIMILVFISAYLLRMLAVIIRQTFQTEKYNFSELILKKPF